MTEEVETLYRGVDIMLDSGSHIKVKMTLNQSKESSMIPLGDFF